MIVLPETKLQIFQGKYGQHDYVKIFLFLMMSLSDYKYSIIFARLLLEVLFL
jgi:hypothetical protein